MRSFAILVIPFVLACQTLSSAPADSAESTQKLAEDAYLYGLQQVIFYETRFNYTQNEGSAVYEGINRWNVVNDGKPIDASFRSIVTPNATTAYAIGFFDLSTEPVVVEMPQVEDRYFSLQIMDPYGIFWLYAGNQFNGTKARSYLIVPEDYDGAIPPEFVTTDVIRVPSRTLCGIIRYARQDSANPAEQGLINGLFAGSTITPLGQWVANDSRGMSREDLSIVPGSYPTFPRQKELTTAQVDKQTAEDFFTLLSLVLNDPSTTPIVDSEMESAMLNRLETIGVGKGLDFDWSKLDRNTQEVLTAGFKAGRAHVKESGMKNLIDMNGWGTIENTGGFATNWLARAIMADFGWLGPDRNISHGAAFAFTDADGVPLDGKHDYTITFDLKDLPPVTQFWELPIYDAEGYFVENEIDRFSINSFDLEKGQLHVADDKLVLYVQHEKPTDPNELKNWLPAPPERFRFTPRFYGPRYSLIDGTYAMPQVVRKK